MRCPRATTWSLLPSCIVVSRGSQPGKFDHPPSFCSRWGLNCPSILMRVIFFTWSTIQILTSGNNLRIIPRQFYQLLGPLSQVTQAYRANHYTQMPRLAGPNPSCLPSPNPRANVYTCGEWNSLYTAPAMCRTMHHQTLAKFLSLAHRWHLLSGIFHKH